MKLCSNFSNNSIIETNDGSKYKKPSATEFVEGCVLGKITGSYIEKTLRRTGLGFYNRKLYNSVHRVSQSEYAQNIDKVLEYSGLKAKGVEIIDAIPANKSLIVETQKKAFLNTIPKILRPQIENSSLMNKLSQVFDRSTNVMILGNNAASIKGVNKIVVNKEKLGIAAFHEMGHSLNEFSKIGLPLQKCRNLRKNVFLSLTALVLLSRKKVKGEECNGKWDKTKTFMRNNAALLTGLGYLPIVIEEGMASFKAAKIAKPFLSKDAYKQMNRFNGKALLTYVAGAGISMLSVYGARFVKDKIAGPKKISEYMVNNS